MCTVGDGVVRRGLVTSVVLTLLLGSSPLSTIPSARAAEGDWPTRHGDLANTGTNGDGAAISQEALPSLRASWAARVGPSRYYEPVAAGERLFVSCAMEVFHADEHCAVAASDGKLLWDTEARAGTSAVDAGTVYVTADSHPASFQALDAATGAPRWSVELGGSNIYAGPQVVDGRVLITTDEGVLRALDAANGRTVWEIEHAEPYASAAVHAGQVYVAARGLVVADVAEGAVRWTGRTPTGAQLAASPAVAGGRVFVGSRGSVMHAYDAAGCGAAFCDPIWTAPYPTVFSPTVADDTVFVVSNREVVALDAGSGELRWRSEEHSVASAPVAVAGGVLFAVGSDGRLLAYHADGCGAQRCAPVWSARIDEPGITPSSGPIIAYGAVYVTGARALYRFSLPGDGPMVCPPGPPRDVRTRSDGSGTVIEWERPTDDGGAPVAVWEVAASDGRVQVVRGADTRTVFDGQGTDVTFTVRGENAAGFGPTQDGDPADCEPFAADPSVSHPSAPRAARLHVGDGALLATWQPPRDDGGHPIERYVVTLEDERGGTRLGETRGERTWAVLGDLDDGVRYRATVAVADRPNATRSAPTSWVSPAAGASLPDPPPGVGRLHGAERIATALDISRERYADGAAAGAVLARADDFPDALTGTPLADAVGGPLLLSHTGALPPAVDAELRRVVPAGARVHLLGGPAALSSDVEAAVADAGFEPVRVAGADRYETAVAVARALADADVALLATGTRFPDALAAGAAAAHHGGVVLLTAGDRPHPATVAHLADRDVRRFAVGGAAARAHPEAEPIVGAAREQTAVGVAERFFPDARVAGLARRDAFPDALVGASHVAAAGGPVLLTASDRLHRTPAAHLCGGTPVQAWLYGGRAALQHAVFVDAAERLEASTCP